MPMELPRLLTRILQADGYDVQDPGAVEGRSGATYSVSMVAQHDGQRRLVDVVAFRKVRSRDLDALAKITKDTGYDGAILFALKGREDGVEDLDHATVELFDRSTVIDRLGELMLDELTPGSGLEVEDAALDLLPIRLDQRPDEPEAPASDAVEDEDLAPVASEQAAEAYSQAAQAAAAGQDPAPAPAEVEPQPDEAPPEEARSEPGQTQAPPEPATASQDDGSDAEWLSEPPSAEPDPEPADEHRPEPAATAEAEATSPETSEASDPADDGSDAEWLTDPPDAEANEKAGLESQPVTDPDDIEIPDDGSDAEWLTDPPDAEANEKAGLESQPVTDPDDIEIPDDGSDAEFLQGSTRESEPEPDGDGQLPPGYQASQGTSPAPEASQAEWLDEQGATGPRQAPEEATQTAALDGPPAANFLVGGCVPIEIDEREARRKGQGTLFSVEQATLQLLPFHAYTYRCILDGEGTRQEAEGALWVSALNGNVVHDPAVNLVDEVPAPFTKLEGDHPAAQAQQDAQRFLCEELVVREEVQQDFGESSIMERIELSPDPDSIEIERHGMVYAARWHLVGKNGEVYVDAATGDVLPA